jgi:CDP-4-dehydro-6-deoxyglucose reductase
MSQPLSLSRAARLVGVSRVDLQRKIQHGELPSFDGTVHTDDLLRCYPQARLEADAEMARINAIKTQAFSRRVAERVLPDKEVLAARIDEMGRELARESAQHRRYAELYRRLRGQLKELGQSGGEAGLAAQRLSAWLDREMSAEEIIVDEADVLMARDALLRVEAAQVRLHPSGQEFFVEGADTLLESALRAGLAPDYGCSNGNCGKCRAKLKSGQIKQTRHHDYRLTEREKADGTFLMCSNTAVSDVEIEAGVAQGVQDIPFQQVGVTVKTVKPLTGDLIQVHVQTPRSQRLRFLAGQAAQLRLAGGAYAATLPIASCPCHDRDIHFHVKRQNGNLFADYVFDRLKTGEEAQIEGPEGEFVLHPQSERPLLFIAFDNGFVPVKSLIEHAFNIELAAPIHLHWYGSAEANLYMANLCRSWTDVMESFTFSPMVVQGDLEAMAGRDPAKLAALLGQVISASPEWRDGDVYIAGPPLVSELAERFFRSQGLAGTRVFACAVP